MGKLHINGSGYIINEEEDEGASEEILSLITIDPTLGVCLLGTPVKDWIELLQLLKAYVQGQEENLVDNAYRPYIPPKRGGVTVTRSRPVRRDAIDADLAAAGWRPYEPPKNKRR